LGEALINGETKNEIVFNAPSGDKDITPFIQDLIEDDLVRVADDEKTKA
jgi:hypothetical protein